MSLVEYLPESPTPEHIDALRNAAAAFATAIDPRPHPYADRPIEWMQNVLHEEMWSAERDIIEAVRTHRYTAVKSSHHQGKSWTASRLVAWFVETNNPWDIFVVTTAPDETKVKVVLWQAIADAWRRGNLKGRVLEKEWKVDVGAGPDQLVAYGRKPADTDAVGLFGTHARKMLIILDEAGGIPAMIFEGINAITTSGEVHVLAIGNPDDPNSHFATICKPGSGWHVMRLDGLRSPNFTAEEVKKYPELQRYMIANNIPPSTEPVSDYLRGTLLSPEWAAERLRNWKSTSPMWISRVRGEFPTVTAGTLIEPRWITAAQARDTAPQAYMARFGVDVARFGDDHSIVVLRQGQHARVVVDIPFGPVTELAGRIQQLGLAMGLHIPPVANVDDTGVGGGVTDILVENNYPVLPLVAGGASTHMLPNGRPKYPNCVTADARVRPIGRLLRVYRARYEGPLFRVDMASGDNFTATANHNVLTGRGWAAVQTLRAGDHLSNSSLGEAVTFGEPEVDHMPPTIGEIYGAIRDAFGAERIAGGTVNFHGDRPTAEVEVVTIDRQLLGIEPSRREGISYQDLVRLLNGPRDASSVGSVDQCGAPLHDRDIGNRLRPGRHEARRASAPSINSQSLSHETICLGDAPNRRATASQLSLHHERVNVQSAGDLLDRRACLVTGDDLVRVGRYFEQAAGHGLAPWLDLIFPEESAKDIAVHVEVVAQRSQRLASEVPMDEVLRVDVIHPGGHEASDVYTMETTTGAYASSSTVHRNCRSEWWWGLREALAGPSGTGADGYLDLDPDDDDLAAELLAVKYTHNSKGQIVVESKEDMRKRGLLSPDRADALAYSLVQEIAQPVAVPEAMLMGDINDIGW